MRMSRGPWWNKTKNSWYGKVNGRNVSLRCKWHEKRIALERWIKLMAASQEGAPKIPEALSLEELMRLFLEDSSHRVNAGTLSAYRNMAVSIIRGLGQFKVEELSSARIHAWVKSNPWSPSYRSTLQRTLRTAIRFALRTKRIAENPIADLKIRACESRGAKSVISLANYQKIMEAAKEPVAGLMKFLWEVGCRPGEASALTAACVDLERGVARLDEHKTAGHGRSRVLVLNSTAIEILKPLVEKYPRGPLFRTGAGNPWTRERMTESAGWLSKQSGVKFHCYGFRHTFATRMLKAGLPMAYVAALLGHTSTHMVSQHYSHLHEDLDALRGALNSVS